MSAKLGPACFAEGDHVLWFGRDGNSEYGQEAVITTKYGCVRVADSADHHADLNSLPFTVRVGYRITLDGTTGNTVFAPAHALTDLECKPRHIQLVSSGAPHEVRASQ